jgi:hypothetical protein
VTHLLFGAVLAATLSVSFVIVELMRARARFFCSLVGFGFIAASRSRAMLVLVPVSSMKTQAALAAVSINEASTPKGSGLRMRCSGRPDDKR